jgi:hypothetical protein
MKQTSKMIGLLPDIVFVGIIVVYSILLLLTAEPTMKQFGTLLGLATLMLCNLYMSTKNVHLDISLNNEIKQAAKLVEGQAAIIILQDTILKELNTNNEKTTALVVSQAELLSKMTASLIKKKEAPTPEAKIPAVGLTAEEVTKING